MPDMEKVIASLGNALVQMHGCGRYTPEDVDELETAAWKALELLELLEKEQDAVKPKLSMSGLWYECPVCHRHLTKNSDNYCARCGKPVLWEGR